MFQLDRLKQTERSFFSFFEIDPPHELYQIYDKREFYWTAKEKGQHIKIKYARDVGLSDREYGTDQIHRYRKTKGGFYERDGVTMFRVTYAVREIEYAYFKVFLNDHFIDDYDNFLELLPSAQS
ncbi:hypothetical protein [Heyndrickxia sporothermodurans]|uniref:hypothetical protein n=1 Tax=Heyndrickxia sporothermodurans TaxID=46224 RepID=UPI000D3C69E3|nr:hypothetical protein [Heyndrickxia sporothermodurans]PTY93010.1 hypothetical protein B5V90_02705 [Heyndrickxia sporothermodurans]